MIDLAHIYLIDKKKPVKFSDVYDKIAVLKAYTDEEKAAYISQFYTDLSVDGRFLAMGQNKWALRRWYPVDEADEEVTVTPKKKKKAAAKK
nr:DNA-directed RNA polymerase subunit delta [Virgibacillus halotolerans]